MQWGEGFEAERSLVAAWGVVHSAHEPELDGLQVEGTARFVGAQAARRSENLG